MTASPASVEERHQPVDSGNSADVSPSNNPPSTRKKNWEVFPGRNKFFCDGRIMVARQTGVLYFTLSLIIITMALFFAFDCRLTLVKLPVGFLIPVVAGLLCLFVIFCLLRTAWSDPGIIPRASPEEAAYIEKCIQDQEAREENSSSYRSPPRSLDVVIKGAPVKLKYCFTCKIFRPPRASHCSLCDNCVENFDHHCPWVGNCVGRRNYRFFFLFVSSLSLLCIYIFSFAIVNVVIISTSAGIVEAIKTSPGSILEIIVCFLSVWSVLGLAGFHSYLIFHSITTNEDIKRTWSKKRENVKNPFDHGGCLANFAFTLCSPLPPSLIDRRGYATQESIDAYELSQRQNGTLYGSSGTQANVGGKPYPTMGDGGYPRQPTLPLPNPSNPASTASNAANSNAQENRSSNQDEPSVTISHHALPNDSASATARFSYNSNNSIDGYQGGHTNQLSINDDLSSQPALVIEHLGPGSALTMANHSDGSLNVSASSTDSRTLLIKEASKQNGISKRREKQNNAAFNVSPV